MRIPPLLADFSHARACKPFCENSLTLPRPQSGLSHCLKREIQQGEKPLLDFYIVTVKNLPAHKKAAISVPVH